MHVGERDNKQHSCQQISSSGHHIANVEAKDLTVRERGFASSIVVVFTDADVHAPVRRDGDVRAPRGALGIELPHKSN